MVNLGDRNGGKERKTGGGMQDRYAEENNNSVMKLGKNESVVQ